MRLVGPLPKIGVPSIAVVHAKISFLGAVTGSILAAGASFAQISSERVQAGNASTDNVWVQFYPALRDARR
jgi:hypothetical protein